LPTERQEEVVNEDEKPDLGGVSSSAIGALEENLEENTGRPQHGKVVCLTVGAVGCDRLVLVADLHGNNEAFEKILHAANLNWGEDVLLILGDVIHPAWQGIPNYPRLSKPDQDQHMADMQGSLKLLKKILELKVEHADRVYWIVGNHDNPHFFKTAKAMSQNLLFLDALSKDFGLPALDSYIRFLDMSPLLFIRKGLVAAHGGPVKEKNLIRLLSAGGSFLSGLQSELMGLREVDPREFERDPELNVATQLILGMHRGYIPRRNHEELTYSEKDVHLFLRALGEPDASFVVGHDHDFDNPKEDPDAAPVFFNGGFWAQVWQDTKHYILFSGGLVPGYAVFDGTRLSFIEAR